MIKIKARNITCGRKYIQTSEEMIGMKDLIDLWFVKNK